MGRKCTGLCKVVVSCDQSMREAGAPRKLAHQVHSFATSCPSRLICHQLTSCSWNHEERDRLFLHDQIEYLIYWRISLSHQGCSSRLIKAAKASGFPWDFSARLLLLGHVIVDSKWHMPAAIIGFCFYVCCHGGSLKSTSAPHGLQNCADVAEWMSLQVLDWHRISHMSVLTQSRLF